MKKILFATTALVATAGVAAAEVAVSGSAEIGVVGGNRYSAYGPGANVVGTVGSGRDAGFEFWTDVEVVFTMTGEADNGLTFGAKIDLDEAANANGTDDGGATWFLAFGSARLDMGDTDGAFDWALKEVNLGGGTIDDSETAHPGFNGNAGLDPAEDGQVARFTYTFGDFAAAVSAEVDDTPGYNMIAGVPTAPDNTDTIWGVGFAYKGDLGGMTLGLGIGYQDQNNLGSIIGASIDGALDNGLSFALNYSELNPDLAGAPNVTHWGVGFGYSQNAMTIGVNYGEYDMGPGLSSNGYGVDVNYDFGGGLVLKAGAGVGEVKAGGASVDFDSFSLGLAMSF